MGWLGSKLNSINVSFLFIAPGYEATTVKYEETTETGKLLMKTIARSAEMSTDWFKHILLVIITKYVYNIHNMTRKLT